MERWPGARRGVGDRTRSGHRRDHHAGAFLEPLEQRTLLAGVTIVTHGNAGFFGDPAFPVWVDQVRDDLALRISQDLAGSSGLSRTAVRTGWMRVTDESSGLSFSASVPARSSLQNNGEILISLDWAEAAEILFGTSTDDIGAFVAERLLAPEFSWLLSLPMHFIGHSRGASLIASIADHLGRAGVWVDHLTFLDAHPVATLSDYRDGETVNTPDNVVFADSYFRKDGFWGELFDVDGHAAGGSYAVELVEEQLDESGAELNGFNEEHGDTHLWYRGTVAPHADRIVHGDNKDGPEGVRWATLSQSMRSDWYHDPAMQNGQSTGFHYSRSGVGFTQRPLSGIHDGLMFQGGIGGGFRDAVAAGSGVWPNVLDLDVRGSASVEAGGTLAFEYQFDYARDNGTVELYLDTDLNPFNGRGERLWTRAHPGTGGQAVRTFASTTIPGGKNAGTYYLLARATDGSRDRFLYAHGAVTVRGGGGAEWRAAGGALISGAATADGWMVVTTVNSEGDPLVFADSAGGGWSARNLRDLLGGPAVTGNIESWTDPGDGLTYAAATTGAGLMLYRRGPDGGWTSRNLNNDLPGAGRIVGDITVFIGRDGRVYIGGLDSRGDMILFEGAGGSNWTADNLAESDLAAQGQSMPGFAGPIISYVTAWNGLNMAGLDANGDIQALWWAPGREHWSAANLSAITGAPRLNSGLTAYVTDWGGINIIGLDNSGSVMGTWWVPAFKGQWKVSNLTAIIGGPKLSGNSVTSFVSPWGALNIAGLDSSGRLRVYWWTASSNWQVADITGDATRDQYPAGPVRGLALKQPARLNVLSSAENGDVLRFWWQEQGRWRVQNLSESV